MMSKEQSDIVKIVYDRFLSSEEESWTNLDDTFHLFSFLSKKELIQEAKAKNKLHEKGLRCDQDHSRDECMGPLILDSVESIISLYEETGKLHEKNEYILTFYLVLTELKLVFSV